MAHGQRAEHGFQSGLCRDRPLEAGDRLPLPPPLWLCLGSPLRASLLAVTRAPGALSRASTSLLSCSPGACSFGPRLWVPASRTSPQPGPPPRRPPRPAALRTSKPAFSSQHPCHAGKPWSTPRPPPSGLPTSPRGTLSSSGPLSTQKGDPPRMQWSPALRTEWPIWAGLRRAPQTSHSPGGFSVPRLTGSLHHRPCACLPRLSQGSCGSRDSDLAQTLFRAVHWTAVSPAEHSPPAPWGAVQCTPTAPVRQCPSGPQEPRGPGAGSLPRPVPSPYAPCGVCCLFGLQRRPAHGGVWDGGQWALPWLRANGAQGRAAGGRIVPVSQPCRGLHPQWACGTRVARVYLARSRRRLPACCWARGAHEPAVGWGGKGSPRPHWGTAP